MIRPDMKRIVFFLLLILLSIPILAQKVYKNDRFYVLELGAGFTTEKTGNTYVDEYGDEQDESNGFMRARFISGAFVHPNISVGIGAGFESNYGYLKKSTTPVFVDIRLYTKEKDQFWNSLYLYMDYGKTIKWANSFPAGDYFETGIGVSCVSVGYNYRKLNVEGQSTNVNTVTVSLVFLF